MGHGFSYSKSDFTARYKRLMGYNVLNPFAFHCTGMPIQAAANRLKRECEAKEQNLISQEEHKSVSQYDIMKKMGIAENEIPEFADPKKWLLHFPPIGKKDLIGFGSAIDWRRSFITTELNPYFDSFVRWQFQILKKKNKINFGKRPAIFSTIDKQPCADHERSEGNFFFYKCPGEGVHPQEYTLIKLKVLEFNEKLEQLKGRNVFLVAATLRPETMYGQTNCYILPTGKYGAYEMENNEVFICSEHSIKNMAYQYLTPEFGKYTKIQDVEGVDILGLPLAAPLSHYNVVYALPMMNISMTKGTAIVTSVPSDSPDDFAALRDLQKKEQFRQKYNITEKMVQFDPIPIIDIPNYSNMCAVKACEEFKIQSQNDRVNFWG